MARLLRLEFDGALYHVTAARGNERHSVFLGNIDDDRAAFLDVLASTCERFNWSGVEPGSGRDGVNTGGVALEQLSGDGRRGVHAFVSGDRLAVARICRDQRGRGWRVSPVCRRFVAEGAGAASPWLDLKGQVYLGSEPFVARMQALIDHKRPLQDIPKCQRRALANTLDHYASRYSDRDRALVEAYRTGAYSMQTIAEYFGVSRMTVSRAVNHNEQASGGANVTCEA